MLEKEYKKFNPSTHKLEQFMNAELVWENSLA